MRKRTYSLADDLMQALDELDYRNTAPRREVAKAIAGRERHFAAEELVEQLPDVGRATVFRCLKLWEQTGMLCRVIVDKSFRYQLSHQGHHHHLVCEECGSSEDLKNSDIEDKLQSAAKAHHFQMKGHWVEVYGRCRNCT